MQNTFSQSGNDSKWFSKKSFFRIGMWHSRPPRDPPPFMANTILNFHFDYLNTSLTFSASLLTKDSCWLKLLRRSLETFDDFFTAFHKGRPLSIYTDFLFRSDWFYWCLIAARFWCWCRCLWKLHNIEAKICSFSKRDLLCVYGKALNK